MSLGHTPEQRALEVEHLARLDAEADPDTWAICEHCGGEIDPVEQNTCSHCGCGLHPECLDSHEFECEERGG